MRGQVKAHGANWSLLPTWRPRGCLCRSGQWSGPLAPGLAGSWLYVPVTLHIGTSSEGGSQQAKWEVLLKLFFEAGACSVGASTGGREALSCGARGVGLRAQPAALS